MCRVPASDRNLGPYPASVSIHIRLFAVSRGRGLSLEHRPTTLYRTEFVLGSGMYWTEIHDTDPPPNKLFHFPTPVLFARPVTIPDIRTPLAPRFI